VIHLLRRLPSRVNLTGIIPLRFMPHSLCRTSHPVCAIITQNDTRRIGLEINRYETHRRKMAEGPRRFDCPVCSCLANRPDKSPQPKPRRSRTQRAFLKPRSTPLSSVSSHSRPAPFRFWFQNTRSVLRSLHISVSIFDVQLNEISGGFLELESRSFWLDTIPLHKCEAASRAMSAQHPAWCPAQHPRNVR
jgi:hypothetical protein